MANINVFDFSMVFGVLPKSNRSTTIPPYVTRNLVLYLNLIQPGLHPYHLLRTPGHCDIFCLDCREGNCCLPFTTPGTQTPRHRKDVARRGRPGIPTSTVV